MLTEWCQRLKVNVWLTPEMVYAGGTAKCAWLGLVAIGRWTLEGSWIGRHWDVSG